MRIVAQLLFDPSREEIWRQLSAEIDGRYLPAGYVKEDKVQATHGEWTVTLDTYVVSSGKAAATYTRMRAPYVNPGGFRFTVYRRNMFSGSPSGSGCRIFRWTIRRSTGISSSKAPMRPRVRQLFSNPKIRELIARQPSIHLSVRDGFVSKFPTRVGVDVFPFPGEGEIMMRNG